MLTVKHIDTDGTETILEAGRVEKVQSGDHFSDGIFLDRDPQYEDMALATPPRPYRHVFRFSNRDPNCGAAALSQLRHDPMVYVMNRFGATVATYRL